jgi:protein SCO1/2
MARPEGAVTVSPRTLRWTLVFTLFSSPTWAQHASSPEDDYSDIVITEKLGAPLPVGLEFRDETGAKVRLGDYVDGTKPVLLTPVYYACPRTCNLLLSAFVNSLDGGRFSLATDFRVVTFSIDPRETSKLAAGKKAAYLTQLGDPEVGADWHFLTGDRETVRALTDSIGFAYRYNPQSLEYVHRAALVFYTPDGVLQRYLHGTMVVPGQLELALVDAGQGTVGGFFDHLHLVAFQYDAEIRRYVFDLVTVSTIVGLTTMIVFGLILVAVKRRLAAS